MSGTNYATSYTYDWDDRATDIQYGDATHRVRYGYDGQGKPALVSRNGVTYSYLYNLQGDVIGLVDNAGSLVVEYKYNAWGSITGRAGSLAETLGKLNPFRYRGYVYDEETWMYWLKSRYYYPEMSRFISADVVVGKVGSVNGHNLYAYCGNEPVAKGDELGMWPQWAFGILTVFKGIGQMMAGAALGATVGWTGIGAAAATVLIANGAAEAAKGVGLVANDIAQDTVMYDENILRAGAEQMGGLVGGDVGRKIGGTVYDVTVLTASFTYVPIKYAQAIGRLPIRVPLSSILNNPKDEFVTLGQAAGKVSGYCRTIPIEGYGEISVVSLPNGYYMVCDGHHRIEALRKLGYDVIRVYITK